MGRERTGVVQRKRKWLGGGGSWGAQSVRYVELRD